MADNHEMGGRANIERGLAMMDRDERELALRRMDEAISRFYTTAVNIGNHPFLEFAGVMTAYAKSCRRAHESDIDFTECSRHAGKELPMEGFEVAYLAEKLGCIFGGRVDEVPEWRDASSAPRDGRQFLLLPSRESKAWISAWWTNGRFYETARGVPLRIMDGAMWRDSPALPGGIAPRSDDTKSYAPWQTDQMGMVHEFRLQGLNGGEWQGVGWRDDAGADLGKCDSIEVAQTRLNELLETLVSDDVVRIGGHAWQMLRIVEVVDTHALRVVLLREDVPNPGLEAARARFANGRQGKGGSQPTCEGPTSTG
ncbi:hypothetical protein [Ottowia sp.]|uniref:hypothetical protein n=1 Tax=Ottowia sp. TaxID=1898956 RepID=UPI0025D86914|nr:hypothetical protein [Ottowia sp.]MBK6616299.1 hypothetical protein [Ottowia sp.]